MPHKFKVTLLSNIRLVDVSSETVRVIVSTIIRKMSRWPKINLKLEHGNIKKCGL